MQTPFQLNPEEVNLSKTLITKINKVKEEIRQIVDPWNMTPQEEVEHVENLISNRETEHEGDKIFKLLEEIYEYYATLFSLYIGKATQAFAPDITGATFPLHKAWSSLFQHNRDGFDEIIYIQIGQMVDKIIFSREE